MKKINIYLLLMVSVFSIANVKAAPNVKTEDSTDANTKENKCPYSIIVQDNLSGSKDMDFSDLDCMFYKTNENGEKVLREETDNIDFSCLQSFLDKYTNEEFAEATDNRIAEGFPTNNKYCPVYCVEENEFIFPGFAPQINSGGHFTWTVEKDEDKNILDGLTVRLQGSKICRAQVDLEQWIDDYKDIMEDIEEMIDIKNPTSSSNCTCTKTAIRNDDVICSWSQNPIVDEVTIMSAATYNVFSQYDSQMEIADTTTSSFGGYIRNALISNGVYPEAAFSDAADSNRFAVVWAIVNTTTNAYEDQQAIGNQITSVTDTSIFNDTLFRYDASNSPDSFTNLVNQLSSISDSQTVRIQVYERHCCRWEREKELGWFKSGSEWSQGGGYAGQSRFLAGETVGWRPADSASNVCSHSFTSGLTSSGSSCGSNSSCCSCGSKTTTSCTAGNFITSKAKCEDSGGRWSSQTEPYCRKSSYNIVKDDQYVVVCPSEGTEGTQEQVIAGKTRQCLCGSVPTCPSGYTYSSRTGMCYYADINGIKTKLGVLSGLRASLKQCHDQLIDYDYYLDTDMEIEYNETSDSANNKYFPNKDAAIDTKLIRLDRNTDIDDGENILGEYSSEIVKPSDKSDISETVSFFGETYTFSKDSLPLVYCSLSGNEKICNAAQSNAYSEYWYDWFGRAYIAMYEYKLVDNFYRWVKIPSGESVSTKPTGDYLKYNRYIEIGYPNYPVHFATPAGDYEGLNVRIKNVGYKNYLYNEYQGAIREYNGSLSDRDLTSTEQNNELLHDCYYHVTEGEPYCPTVGCDEDEFDLGSVRIIYRPISLENPFPARDGDGRNTGSNWCIINNEDKTSDCSNENENVDKYILNNRNVVGSEVYNKEPMYQITLNPALIKQIREYNKNTNYDDYNLYCSGKDGEEGTECRSHFVVGGMEETNLPSLSSHFENTCGMSSDWDACDKLDGIER